MKVAIRVVERLRDFKSKSDCERVWVKLKTTGFKSHNIFINNYNRIVTQGGFQ